jgi:hypothetical protein
MKEIVRTVIIAMLALATMAIFSQTKPTGTPATPPAAPSPQLGTADRVAIQSLEKQKQEAATAWQNAQQQELSVLREWAIAHPGFHVHFNPANPQDTQNFAVEADTSVPAPPAKPAETKTAPPEKKK